MTVSGSVIGKRRKNTLKNRASRYGTGANQSPASQIPADQSSADQSPADQSPADQRPADQSPPPSRPRSRFPLGLPTNNIGRRPAGLFARGIVKTGLVEGLTKGMDCRRKRRNGGIKVLAAVWLHNFLFYHLIKRNVDTPKVLFRNTRE